MFAVISWNSEILLGDLLLEDRFLAGVQVANSMHHETKNFDVEGITVLFVILHLIRDKSFGAGKACGLEVMLASEVIGHTKVGKNELKWLNTLDQYVLRLQVPMQEIL